MLLQLPWGDWVSPGEVMAITVDPTVNRKAYRVGVWMRHGGHGLISPENESLEHAELLADQAAQVVNGETRL